MELKVCLGNRDVEGKNIVKSMFSQETSYYPKVIAVILGGAVWLKSIREMLCFKEITFYTNARIRPQIDFSQDRD